MGFVIRVLVNAAAIWLATRIVPAIDGVSPPSKWPSTSVKRPLAVLKPSLVSVTWKPTLV